MDLQLSLRRCQYMGRDYVDVQMMIKHPEPFGMSGPIAWAEIRNQLVPLAELVMQGTSVSKEDGTLNVSAVYIDTTDDPKTCLLSSCCRRVPARSRCTIRGCGYQSYKRMARLAGFGMLRSRRPRRCWRSDGLQFCAKWESEPVRLVYHLGESGSLHAAVARTIKEFNSAVLEILIDDPTDIPLAALYHVSTTRKHSSRRWYSSPWTDVCREQALGGDCGGRQRRHDDRCSGPVPLRPG